MAQTIDEFVKQVTSSGLMSSDDVLAFVDAIPAESRPSDGEALARELVKQKKLTRFQAEQIYANMGASLTLGNYVILDKLGQGGMGMVLKAEHKRMKRLVAIKVMSPGAVKTPDALKRFHREVEAAAKLRHPNIVAADDADEAKGTHFLVMEYVEGSDLSVLIKKQGPFPVDQAVRCIIQAARGLEYAHKRGVIHRDIKPANLLLDREGTVKILDMGLARIEDSVGGSSEGAGLTSTGTIMGTVDYMSPEQAMDTKQADARSDIYSLGCSLYYLLTGKCLYDGDTMMKKLMAHQNAPLPSLSLIRADVPLAVNSVFQKMVAKQAKNRYQSMTEVLQALESCQDSSSGSSSDTPVVVPPESVGSQLQSFLNTVDSKPSPVTSAKTAVQPTGTSLQLTAIYDQSDRAAEATMLSGDFANTMSPQVRVNDIPAVQGMSSPARKNALTKTITAVVIVSALAATTFLWPKTRNKQDQRPETSEAKESTGTTNSGSRQSSDSQSESEKSHPADNDPERIMAEWVIGNGGSVTLYGKYTPTWKIADLPAQPFQISGIAVHFPAPPTIADIERLTRLSRLRYLTVRLPAPPTRQFTRAIAEAWPLEQLDLGYHGTPNLEDADAVMELLKLRSLRSLTLGGVAIDDNVVAKFGQLPALTDLFFYGCTNVRDDGFVRLAANPPLKLRSLGLGRTNVGARGLSAIAKFPHLNELYLDDVKLDDSAIAELVPSPVLVMLILNGTNVTSVGTASLQKSLSDCQIIVSKADQAPPMYGPEYREKIRKLTARGFHVDVWANSFNQTTTIKGEEPLPAGEVIGAIHVWGGPSPVETDDLKLIAQLPDLRELTLGELRPGAIRELLPLKNLRSINFPDQVFSDSDVELLASFKKLANLSINCNGDKQLELMSRFPHLRHLYFRGQITADGLKVLESARPLASVGFFGASEAAAQALANARPDVSVQWNGKRLEAANPAANAAGLNPPEPAKAPFDAPQARVHQEAWAKHLGVPIEYTNSIGMKFRLIPPGEFTMGMTKEIAEANTAKRAGDEHWRHVWTSSAPEHRVRLTQPFYLAITEVTQEQYEKVAGTNPSFFAPNGEGKDKVAGRDTKQHPVEMVSYVDATEFCSKLSQRENLKPVYSTTNGVVSVNPGDGYRLPSEAEWEYACRGGTNTTWFHGDDESLLGTVAWIESNSAGSTQPVGQLKANPFGLFDVHGNVWEWCEDTFDGLAYGNRGAGPTADPRNLAPDGPRVLRGGYWLLQAYDCRSAQRQATNATHRMQLLGLRLSMSVDAVRQSIKAAPAAAKSPFDAVQARAHQEAWARHLGTAVEMTNSVGAKMVLIPPGEFLMGSSNKQIDAALEVAKEINAAQGAVERIQKVERPQHNVVISRPFLMCATEVTIGQFKKFSATGFVTEAEKDANNNPKAQTYLNPGFPVTDDSPAAALTWDDATAFCNWLSIQEKKTIRLPTEAEWEYTCRAGTTTQYSFGDDHNELPKYAWFNTNAGGSSHPAGTLLPNQFGLFDMHGNLFEWCGDWYDEKWYEQTSQVDPTGPASGTERVLRSGRWGTSGTDCRSAYRHFRLPSNRYNGNGFRYVMELSLPVGAANAGLPKTEEWTDWLGPKLQRNEIVGNGWIREGEAFTTEREVSGIAVIPNDTRNGAVRLTYQLRDSKGIVINARDRKTDNTDATRELYVVQDHGTQLTIRLGRAGVDKVLTRQEIPASIPQDAPRTLEFRVIGDTLTATLNGSVVATAKDSTVPAGNFALVALKGVLIQKVKYQSPDKLK